MKFVVCLVPLFFFAGAIPGSGQTGGAALAENESSNVRVVEEIVAKVNNEIITRGELAQSRRQLELELKRQNVTGDKLVEALAQAEKEGLRDRIDQLLLVQKARDLDISVDSELTKYLAQIQLEHRITDPEKLQQLIREQTGMSYEDFRQQVRDSMMTRRVIQQEVGSKIVIPRAELAKYYEEHKDDFIREEQVFLREIFISTEGKDEAGVAAAEKKAKELLERARQGENFGNLARDNSDADTARNYGELGAFKPEELRKEIADLVFKQDKNYVTDVLKQPNGFLILKVENRWEAGLQPLEVVENEIMDRLFTPRMQPAVRAYLTKLRQDAFLEIREGYIDSGAAPGKDTSWTDPAQLKPETITKQEVINQPRRRRLFWLIPIPGTQIGGTSTSSSGR